jgi:drug/metabolite transporter (DMT)-like permease
LNPLVGIALKVVSALAFTIMSAGIKSVGADYPIGQVVFFRSAFAIVPLVIWLAWQGGLVDAVRTHDLRAHILRGIIGSCGMFSGFLALSYLPLSDAVAIGYAAPLMTVVLAALVLKEKVRVYRWSAVVIGFVGVLIMLSPHLKPAATVSGGIGGPAIGALFGILAAGCTAGAMIQVRRLTATEKTGAIVLYFSLLTTCLGLVTIVLGWRMPSPHDLALLILIGILGGIGQILLTQSYRFADASLVAPFDYITMIWAVLIGWFAFAQWPGIEILAGGVIVAFAGLYVLWREHRLGLVRLRQVETGGAG